MAEFLSAEPVVDRDTRFRITLTLSKTELAILSDAVRNHCNPDNVFAGSVLLAVRTAHGAVKAAG
jgi:hypothetical protein